MPDRAAPTPRPRPSGQSPLDREWFPDRVGDYRILREVGRGGMAVVFEAEQLSLRRHVALKVLPGSVMFDDPMRKRFEREACVAGRLHHTNIVPIFGVGEHQGVMYYAMQYIDGYGLDQLLCELRSQTTGVEGDGQPRRPENLAGVGVPKGGRLAAMAQALSQGRLALSLPATEEGRSPVASAPTRVVRRASPPTLMETRSPRSPSEPDPLAGRTFEEGHPRAPQPRSRADQERAGRGARTVISSPPTAIGTTEHGVPDGEGARSRLSDSLAGSLVVPPPRMRPEFYRGIARIGLQLASALQHAHQHGILHRDVKPGNIMFDAQGNVWLTDFGLAKAEDHADLTVVGDVLGTFRYMSPEAIDGRAEPRSDIYALGLTLFELITLSPAFPGRQRSIDARSSGTVTVPRVDRLQSAVPRDLATIIEKAIETAPERRYATAEDFAQDLQLFLDDEPIKARPISSIEHVWRWAKRHRTAATAAALFVGSLVTFSILMAGMYLRLVSQTNLTREASERARDVEDTRVVNLVAYLESAGAGSVPNVIHDLAEASVRNPPLWRKSPRQLISERLPEVTEVSRRVRLLAGLTAMSASDSTELVRLVPDLDADSAKIALPALRSDRERARRVLMEMFDWDLPDQARAHIAWVLLELGEPTATARILALREDLSARHQMLRVLAKWYFEFESWPEALGPNQPDALRSGLCLALAQIPPAKIPPDVNRRLNDALNRLQFEARDAGTHSAVVRALEFRGIKPAELAVELFASSPQRDWWVSPDKMTFVTVPSGWFFPFDYRTEFDGTPRLKNLVVISRRLHVRDRVTTHAEYTEFLNEWPRLHPGAVWQPVQPNPVGGDSAVVDWRSAVAYCNWLSARHGRRSCYRLPDGNTSQVEWDLEENGYRLLTVAEQEHIYRCGTRTPYFCGVDPANLDLYLGDLASESGQNRSCLPNPWGLFELVGHIPQMSWDAPVDFGSRIGVQLDPMGSSGVNTAIRGGIGVVGNLHLPASFSISSPCTQTAAFRIACCDDPPASPQEALNIADQMLAARVPSDLEEAQRQLTARMLLAVQGAQLDKAAEFVSQLLDTMPGDRGWAGVRSIRLRYLIARHPGLISELLRVRPHDTLLRTAVARSAAQKLDWSEAATRFMDVIRECPVSEEWFECVVVLTLAGRVDDREEILRVLAERSQTATPAEHYALARAFAAVDQSPIDSRRILEWAASASAQSHQAWTVHTEGLAQYRSGDLVSARKSFELSVQMGWSSWGTSLNRLGIALVLLRENEPDEARKWIHQAHDIWQGVTLNQLLSGDIAPADWFEFQLLVQEVRQMLDQVTERAADEPAAPLAESQ